MDPSEIENAKKFSIRVGRLIRMNPAEIYSKYKANKNKRFVWLKRQVDAQTRVLFEGLKNNKIEGLGVIRELRRQYPQGDSLAPLLGRVSIDGEGLEGIEREFDKNFREECLLFELLEMQEEGFFISIKISFFQKEKREMMFI